MDIWIFYTLKGVVKTILAFTLSIVFVTIISVQSISSQDKFVPKTIGINDPEATPHILVGGYYTVKNGMKSKLLLNNKGGHPIEIKPTLYGLNGEILEITPITVAPNRGTLVDISDWVNIGGLSFQEGSIRLFHRGTHLVIGSQIQITNEQNSHGFEYKLQELRGFDSRRMDSVWWNPNNQTETSVVLTNTLNKPLAVTAKLNSAPNYLSAPLNINLQPHETKVLNIERDFQNGEAFVGRQMLGMSVTHAGRSDSLLVWGMTKDSNSGYSNTISFRNASEAGSKELHGANLQMTPVANQPMQQVVLLRNVSKQRINLNLSIPVKRISNKKKNRKRIKYERNAKIEKIPIGPIPLEPNGITRVDLDSLSQLQGVKTAGLEIRHSGKLGSLVASAESVSQDNNHVFKSLLWDNKRIQSATGAYPFFIEGSSKSMVHIKNTSNRKQGFYAHLLYGDRKSYLPR